ncbi:hypothetical protein CF137_21185 [Aeromonas sobria]|nr:hypothetical protein CF137_21185 [Aeromonas sobria]
MITHPPPQIPMETPRRKRKNFNKIELLPKKRGLPGNTSSWLVLQSFHPPMAGFFLSAVPQPIYERFEQHRPWISTNSKFVTRHA